MYSYLGDTTLAEAGAQNQAQSWLIFLLRPVRGTLLSPARLEFEPRGKREQRIVQTGVGEGGQSQRAHQPGIPAGAPTQLGRRQRQPPVADRDYRSGRRGCRSQGTHRGQDGLGDARRIAARRNDAQETQKELAPSSRIRPLGGILCFLPQRGCVLQPRVAPRQRGYPGYLGPNGITPTGLWPLWDLSMAQPRWGKTSCDHSTQG